MSEAATPSDGEHQPMPVDVCWDPDVEQPPARLAAYRVMTAVAAKDRAGWLALFAPDAVLEDPVGTSLFDPSGQGHRGHEAIAAFWDGGIAGAERIAYTIRDSHAAGDEVANVGTVTADVDGHRIDTDGVFLYRVREDGLLVSLRAFWEVERTFATRRPLT